MKTYIERKHTALSRIQLLLLALTALVWHPATTQAQNILEVKDFEGALGKAINVPVYLTNTDEVVAAQFDVELPFAPPSGATAMLTNRSNQHSVSMKSKSSKAFTVVVMSMQNNTLRGNAGLLLRLPMQAYDDGQTSTPYPVRLSNIVLTNRQGDNIATAIEATGHFTVSRADIPDLTVPAVTPVTTGAGPSQSFSVNYTVANEGTGPTLAGWTEKIYFESATTSERIFIGSQVYSSLLAAQRSVSRSYTAVLPALIHADGSQYVVVEVVPDDKAGELIVDQGNNTGRSANTVNVAKELTLRTNKLTISEGGSALTLTISRSGDWSTEETFPLTCSVNGLLSVGNAVLTKETPVMVTIPARSASRTVYVYAVDDDIVRTREADLMVGDANGYEGKTLHINRTDNDTNPLSLSASVTEMTEGDGQQLVLTATRGGELTEPLQLTVSSSQALRFLPSPVTIDIPAGQATGTITMTLIDDDTPQADVTAVFSTRATDYQRCSTSVRLIDDDRPALTLTLSPSMVSEAAGTTASQAVIRRDRGYDKDMPMTVMLSSASASNVYFTQPSVTFSQGEREKTVAIGVADNSAVDGLRSYQLTAALLLPSTNTVAKTGDRAYAGATMTVTDDESPYLALTSRVGMVGEGSSLVVTVRRYVSDTSSPLTVSLTADQAADATLPATVTIPAGYTSADVSVGVVRNSVSDDERPLYINATAAGMGSGQLSLRITDRTLPDAACSTPGTDGSQLFAGMAATFTPVISNVGTATLPADMQVDFFLANSDRLDRYTTTIPVFTARTEAPIEPGESLAAAFSGTMPAAVGNYWLYVRLNSDGKLSEFSTSNNVSTAPAKVTIAAPFSVTALTTDADSYLPGQTVKVTGKVTSLLTGGLVNQYVNVTMEGSGQSRKTITCQVNPESGDFTAYPEISGSAGGMLTIKARAQGQTEADMQTTVNVWNLQLTADAATWSLNHQYQRDGYFTLTNTSGKTVTGLTIAHGTLPFGCVLDDLQLSTTTLEPGQSTQIAYRVTPTEVMTDGKYSQLTVTATSNEGATATLPIRYYCRATNCVLTFENNPENTTLLLGTTRTIQLKVTNHGLRESGVIDMVVPSELPWLINKSGLEMASIPAGASAYITLELRHLPDMHSGTTHSAYLTLNPTNGASVGTQLNATIVGTEYSTLDVDVADIYVMAKRNFEKVSAAQVAITDARTGKSVMTGVTDGVGHWTTDKITQGTYHVTVSALRHKSVRQTLVIGPGDSRKMAFFLPYQAVLTDFVATQDIEDNSYHLTATIDIDLQAPQAIVIPELPEEGFECGSADFNITLRNQGPIAARDVQLVFPSNIASTTFTVGQIGVIAPHSEVVVPVHYTGPESGKRRTIGKILMHYAFDMAGMTYAEDDYYQSLMGCVSSNQPLPPTVDPVTPQPDGMSGTDDSSSETQNEARPQGPSANVSLPTLNSSVTLTFDDVEHVSVGNPFYATLNISNGQSGVMRNIRFTHTVSDDDDDFETDMTTLFTCEQAERRGFTLENGLMQLGGQQEGSIRLAFVPTADVTADGQHVYYIGGQLTYTDVAKGISNMVSLPQMALTVSQKGQVSIVYLLQKDFLGSESIDGQTTTAVPGQYVMLVSNESSTDVSNLQLQSDETLVTDNATGGEAVVQTLMATVDETAVNQQPLQAAIGKLSRQQTATARWILESATDSHLAATDGLTSTLTATADAEVEATISGVHNLYRPVKDMASATPVTYDTEANREEIIRGELASAREYLLDDEEDDERQPDHILLSDGTQQPLHIIGDQLRAVGSAGTYTLTVDMQQEGWFYLRIPDPTQGAMLLESVTRGSTVVSEANAWTTDHRVLSDYSSIAENQFHLADKVPAGQTVYTLTFVPRPGEPVKAMSCKLLTADNTEVTPGTSVNQRVAKVQVEFTRSIRKFAMNYVSLTIAGQTQDKDLMTVVQENDERSSWTLDLTGVEPTPGLHQLMVDVSRLRDTDNHYGTGTVALEWTENIDKQVTVTTRVEPDAEAGSIDKPTGLYSLGQLQVKSQPAEGWQFDYWTADGRRIADADETLDYDVRKKVTLAAHFSRRLLNVSIVCDAAYGSVSPASGVCEWGQPLMLSAIPNDGYEFWRWVDDDGHEYDTREMTVTVTADRTYTAEFRKAAPASVTVAMAASGFVTYASKYALDLDGISGATAYYAKSIANSQVTFVPARGIVKAGEGLLLRHDGGEVTIPVADASATAISDNLLVGCPVETVLTARADQYVLVGGVFQSLATSGATIPAGKAYLQASASGAARLTIAFDDELTGIANVAQPMADERVYDLQGRKVSKSSKGLYIVNRKKYVAK